MYMLRDMPRLLVFWQPQLKVRKWDRREKKWKSMFWNEVFIIHYSLPKSVEKMLMANFCRHQAYLGWKIRQQLLFAVANFKGWYLPVQSQQWKHKPKFWNLLKITNEDNITASFDIVSVSLLIEQISYLLVFQ